MPKCNNNNNDILSYYQDAFNILLKDQTRSINGISHNIIYATHDYERLGFGFFDEISDYAIKNIVIIRAQKEQSCRVARTKQKAEVFTPSWICNLQINSIDDAWFKNKNIFNAQNNLSKQETNWITNKQKISFPKDKPWLDYVKATRLEIACGEAPYLVSRYDAATGNPIALESRIGILDRKLRVICENAQSEKDWLNAAFLAYKSTYAYEYQGDSLYIARKQLLYSFIEYFKRKFKKLPNKQDVSSIAEIISWNIWQMDGIRCAVPNKNKRHNKARLNLYKENQDKSDIYCIIKNWLDQNKSIRFVDLLARNSLLKFNAIIGNPPYHAIDGGGSSSAYPIYDKFIDIAKRLNPDYISMIIPARWMTGGKGLDKFRQSMLNDNHILMLHDYLDSKDCFSSVSIDGGICCFLRDKDYSGKCKIITHALNKATVSIRQIKLNFSDVVIRIPKAVSIIQKVLHSSTIRFSSLVSTRNPFKISNNDVNLLPVSYKARYKVFCRIKNARQYRSLNNLSNIKQEYLNCINSWKIFVSKADGAAGQLGSPIPARILGNVEIGKPGCLCSETFLFIGPFKSYQEAKNAVIYTRTKFFRYLLGIRKLKNMTASTYSFVPLENLSNNSDIPWRASINTIDKALYAKYKFTQSEIIHIESMITELQV